MSKAKDNKAASSRRGKVPNAPAKKSLKRSASQRAISMQGPVKKLSDVLKVWNNRYFMLIPRNKTLVYYINRPKTDHEDSKGGYDLSDGISLRDLPKVPHGFMICVPGKPDIVLQVPAQKDKMAWIKALKPFTHNALKKGEAAKANDDDDEIDSTADGQHAWMWESILNDTQPPHRNLQERKEALDQESNRLYLCDEADRVKKIPKEFFVGTIPKTNATTEDVHGLREAIRSDDHDTVLALLEKEPSLINSTDVYLNTPLHLAAISNATTVTMLLLHKGANATARNKLNETAVQVAPETLALLILDRSAEAAEALEEEEREQDKADYNT